MSDTHFQSSFSISKQNTSCNKPEELETNEQKTSRSMIFSLFLYVVIFSNFDTGVIPAALIDFQNELKLDQIEEAAIGSLPFFGISFGSLIVSFCMRKLTTIRTLFIALIFNILSSIWFALSYSLVSMYFARFFMGFSQAFWVVYGPVWTNQFSPSNHHTTWLGILQGFSPIGIILGYIITGIIVNNWSSEFSWRLAVLIQAFGEAPIMFAFFFVKNEDLDIFCSKQLEITSQTEIKEAKNSDVPVDNSPDSPGKKLQTISHFRVLITNYMYVLGVCTNCVAFFVVFGLQFWGTLYIINILDSDPTTAMIAYSCITITAPFLGVFLGGFISDRCGGYKGKQVSTALKLCLGFSLLASVIGVLNGMFVFTLKLWAPLLWLQIFFGACMIPPGSGVIVNSVEKEYQTSASGFAQLVYNILGYFLSPLFSAAIMQSFDDRKKGMIWGYLITIIIYFIFFNCCFFFIFFKILNLTLFE